MPTVDEAQRKAIGKALRTYADAMQLRDWTVTVGHKSVEDSDHGAEVDAKVEQHEAVVVFREDAADFDTDDMRRLLVHELAHCYFARLVDLLDETIGPILGKQLGTVVSGILDVELERACEAIAQSLAPHLPPFTWDAA